ncbi:MAG TPA: RagB/SusD family nutrient uptake outer membrane protein, partial [Chitinophagaceae bacterium]|nr:RagB/SusD family nutrient uptake outer membrane protein [Chitinophagaceae bacterium]
YTANAQDPLATLGMPKDAFDTKVIQERNYELCFEYDRWFDLIRKHILKQMSDPTIQQNFSEDDYLFPIPTDDIRLNPLLTQNPGY